MMVNCVQDFYMFKRFSPACKDYGLDIDFNPCGFSVCYKTVRLYKYRTLPIASLTKVRSVYVLTLDNCYGDFESFVCREVIEGAYRELGVHLPISIYEISSEMIDGRLRTYYILETLAGTYSVHHSHSTIPVYASYSDRSGNTVIVEARAKPAALLSKEDTALMKELYRLLSEFYNLVDTAKSLLGVSSEDLTRGEVAVAIGPAFRVLDKATARVVELEGDEAYEEFANELRLAVRKMRDVVIPRIREVIVFATLTR
jgi:hypothetical protein